MMKVHNTKSVTTGQASKYRLQYGYTFYSNSDLSKMVVKSINVTLPNEVETELIGYE